MKTNKSTFPLKQKIEAGIENLLEDFRLNPNNYLTESDVRCTLVHGLRRFDDFSSAQDTEDDSKSIPLHTEVRWYGNSGKLKFRSDIVILDVATLQVRSKSFKLPSKGYGFNKPLAIIEIKLRRTNGESDNQFIAKIQKDIYRLNQIKYQIKGTYPSYLIILDKRKSIKEKLPEDKNIEIQYEHSSGKVN